MTSGASPLAALIGAYHYMDLVPKDRDEDGQGESWVRRRDEYPD